MEKWIGIVMGGLLLIAAVEDIKEKKVHSVLLGSLVLVGIIGVVSNFINQTNNMWQVLGGLLIGLCMVGFSLISQGQLGMADGVVMIAIGLLYGGRDCLVVISIASMCMALISIVLLVLRKGNRKTTLPFVPALMLGYCIVGWVG